MRHAECLPSLARMQSHHLLSAAKSGDGAEVQKCLEGGVDVNCSDQVRVDWSDVLASVASAYLPWYITSLVTCKGQHKGR
jgi:hypothetical protein